MQLTEQGYYNLIIYEADAEDFKSLFAASEHGELENHLNDIEEALDYINDRLIEDRPWESEQYGDAPSMSELVHKAIALEKLRVRVLGDEYYPHIDLNVILTSIDQ